MARVRSESTKKSTRKIRPALTPEARENQLIALATDLVEQRLLDGTASSQETTFYLKQGSIRARMEMEKLKAENELLRAKTKALDSAEDLKILYEDAIKALRSYAGHGDPYDD